MYLRNLKRKTLLVLSELLCEVSTRFGPVDCVALAFFFMTNPQRKDKSAANEGGEDNLDMTRKRAKTEKKVNIQTPAMLAELRLHLPTADKEKGREGGEGKQTMLAELYLHLPKADRIGQTGLERCALGWTGSLACFSFFLCAPARRTVQCFHCCRMGKFFPIIFSSEGVISIVSPENLRGDIHLMFKTYSTRHFLANTCLLPLLSLFYLTPSLHLLHLPPDLMAKKCR